MHSQLPIGLALLCLASAIPGAHAGAPQPDTRAQFATPQLFDIGARRMHIYCSGKGPVTVLFDAQGGAAGWSWYRVQPKVAQHTRACVYDRAGHGFSDPSPRPATFGNAVEDLRKLLAVAGIAPPYLLVGSSFGGANAQLYAYRYPDDVKALVLVEGHREDEIARANSATGGKLKTMMAQQGEMNDACLAQVKAGMSPGSEAMAQCVGATDAAMGPRLGAVDLATRMKPAFWQTLAKESRDLEAGDAELRAARRPFGDLPLIVLARTVNPYAAPGKPPSAIVKAMEAENLSMQKETAALSTRGELRVIKGAGHIIHETHPQAVVKAVLDLLEQAKR